MDREQRTGHSEQWTLYKVHTTGNNNGQVTNDKGEGTLEATGSRIQQTRKQRTRDSGQGTDDTEMRQRLKDHGNWIESSERGTLNRSQLTSYEGQGPEDR